MSKTLGAAVLALALTSARAHPGFLTPTHLNPVHSLYVKPSGDGSTGDLYVAATEENGVKSQWLTDQPVNFMPQHTPVPSYPYSSVPRDETVTTQKRAVVTSPAFKFAYGLPTAASADGSNVVPYTYATGVPAAQPVAVTEGNKECPGPSAPAAVQAYPHYQYQSPFHYYYPQMMAAFATAINELKDAGVSEKDASSLISQIMPQAQTAPMWPTYAYPHYPVQYVMVDPATWAQSQAAAASTTASPPTISATADAEEASDNSDESV